MATNKTFYLIIGSFFLPCDEHHIKDKYYKNEICVSNEMFEKKLLFDSFIEKGVKEFCFLSAPRVGVFPFSSKKLFVKGFTDDEHIKTVNYCSLYGVIHFSKTRMIIKKANEIINSLPPDTSIHVIGSECHGPYLKAIKYIKKRKNGAVFSTLIVPDLPEYMVRSNNFFYRFFKKIDVNNNYRIASKYIDSFLCLTYGINERINPNKKPFIIKEGVVEKNNNQIVCDSFNDKMFHCAYIGRVDERNGIQLIIDLAKSAPQNVVFDVYGSGNAENRLKSLKIPSLRYHGFVDASSVNTILQKSDIVLSLRQPIGDYIYYSFPSKIFDYVSNYKKIVAFRLPTFFKELDKIIFYPKDYSCESIMETINLIKNKRVELDIDAVNTVLEEYNNVHILNQIMSLKK